MTTIALYVLGVLVFAVGGMDALPSSLPTWWREGIATVRPAPVRRLVRRTYRRVHPGIVRATGGRWRALPQAATDRYLTRVVEGVRHFRPGLPVVVLTPPPWRSPRSISGAGRAARSPQPPRLRACPAAPISTLTQATTRSCSARISSRMWA